MTIQLQLDVQMPAGAAWPTIPDVESAFPLDGLLAYFAPEDSALDANGRIATLGSWFGDASLVQPSTGTAPALANVGARKMMRTTIARADRLVVAPAPNGGGWPGNENTDRGFSVSFLTQVLNNAVVCGLVSIYGFRIRATNGSSSTTRLQVQKLLSGGGTRNADALCDFTSSALRVVGITYDPPSTQIKLFADGVQIGSQTNAEWGIRRADVGVYGSGYSGSETSEANFGKLVLHDRVLTTAEMSAVAAEISA